MRRQIKLLNGYIARLLQENNNVTMCERRQTKQCNNSSSGFTLQELLVVMGVMAVLLGIATINLVTIQNRTNLNTQISTLTAEIKQQQLKAMLGDTEGRTDPDAYGVLFESDGYTLFHGTSFNSGDSANYKVTMADNMIFTSINLPNQTIIFDRVSGDILNFNLSLSSVSLTNTTNNESKTLQFNKHGVISSIN